MKFINNGNLPIFSDFIDKYESKLSSSVPEFKNIDIELFKFNANDFVKHINSKNPLPIPYDLYDLSFIDTPFIVNNSENVIYYIYDLCDKITSRDEQYALILHEVGHIYNNIIGKCSDKEEEKEEGLADEFACRFICRKHLINAIFKMVKDDRFKGKRTYLIKRIRALKAGRKFFCWRH